MPQKKKQQKKNAAKRAANKKQQQQEEEKQTIIIDNNENEKPPLPEAPAPAFPPQEEVGGKGGKRKRSVCSIDPPSLEDVSPPLFEQPMLQQQPPIQFIQVPGQMDFPKNSSESIDAVQEMTGKGMKVEVIDGRVFEGVFVCTDRQNNLILRNTEEFRSFNLTNHLTGKTKEVKESHMIGLVTIPGSVVIKIELWESGF